MKKIAVLSAFLLAAPAFAQAPDPNAKVTLTVAKLNALIASERAAVRKAADDEKRIIMQEANAACFAPEAIAELTAQLAPKKEPAKSEEKPAPSEQK